MALYISTMASCFTHSNTGSTLQEIVWGGWSAISETGVKLFAYQKSCQKTLLTCGIPQGSVLSPFLFSIFTIPLARIIRSHGLSYHMYAYDAQLFMELCRDNKSSQTVDIRKVERCVADIREWMRYNDDKIEFILSHPKSTLLNSLKVWQ